jgi:hypothetical protein
MLMLISYYIMRCDLRQQKSVEPIRLCLFIDDPDFHHHWQRHDAAANREAWIGYPGARSGQGGWPQSNGRTVVARLLARFRLLRQHGVVGRRTGSRTMCEDPRS